MTSGTSCTSDGVSCAGDGVVSEGRLGRLRRSSLFISPILLLSSLSHAAVSSEWTIEVLMGLLKEQSENTVAFQETTYSSLLTEPLMASGELKFVPPDRLEKVITSPSRERYVVEGDRVTFESERKGVKRTISLEEYPALRSFVEAFRSSLNGDAARLRQAYEITLDGSRGKWTLLLRPRDPTGNSVVDYILLTGSEGRVATIAIRSPDGDRSVMTLLHKAGR
jgi:Outer membrane lipoprotein carrier protein LolA-like